MAIYIDVIVSLISVEIKEAMVLCSCKLLDEMTCISTFVNIGMHSVLSKNYTTVLVRNGMSLLVINVT